MIHSSSLCFLLAHPSTRQFVLPMFSRNVIISVRALDAQHFQSLVDYAGSRALASATALLQKMSMMEADCLRAMTEAVSAEIVCVNGIKKMSDC